MQYLLLFLIIFDPQIPGFIGGVGFTAIVAPALIVALFIKNKGRIQNTNAIQSAGMLALIHFALLLFALLILMATGDNFAYLLSIIKAILVFASVVAYLIFFKQRFDESFFSKLLLLYSLNAVINFGAGTFPEYFTWAEPFRGPVISDEIGINPYRNNFISGSGYFSIGTAYGLFCLFYMFFKSRRELGLISGAGLLISSVAGFFGARTSMFAIGGGIVYLLKDFQLKKIATFFIICIFIAFILFDEDGILSPYKTWLFGFFDGKSDASADYLLNEMFYWPGEKIFFIGSGFVNDGRFIYTDSGFMQDILFGGVFYMILKFSFPLYFFVKFFKNAPSFALIFIGAAFAFQIKGAFFTSNAQGMAIFYLMHFFFCDKYRLNSKISRKSRIQQIHCCG